MARIKRHRFRKGTQMIWVTDEKKVEYYKKLSEKVDSKIVYLGFRSD